MRPSRIEYCTAPSLVRLAIALFLLIGGSTVCPTPAYGAPTSITLTWTAPGDDGTSGTASQYDIRYSTSNISSETAWNSATQVAGEPSPQAAGSDESFTVTGLQPSTTYYFAMKTADESANWSEMSNVTSRATDTETEAPEAVATLAVTLVTSTAVTLSWTAPGDDGDQGTASSYDIRYATWNISAANWNSATQATGEPAPQTAGSSQSFTIGGLDPGTTYYFAMRASDEVPNVSGLSNVVNATTGAEQNAPAALTDVEATVVTGTSISLSWTATGDDGSVGTASTYDIRFANSAINEANWNSATSVVAEPDPNPAGTAESFLVTGLSEETTYYFAIKVADEVPNWSSLSNIAEATTPDETPPMAVDNLEAIP